MGSAVTLIDKAYFTLEEIEERWSLPRRDIAYLAENGLLRLSVRAFCVRIEHAYMEQTLEGEWCDVPYNHTNHSGLLDLLESDAFELFRDGCTTVTCFYHPGEIIRLIGHTPILEVSISDIVVRREERDRVEAEHRLVPSKATDPVSLGILIAADGRSVQIGDEVIPLGPVQAEVVRRLRAASDSGTPWQDGKALLRDAGATTMRLAALPDELIEAIRAVASVGAGRAAGNLAATGASVVRPEPLTVPADPDAAAVLDALDEAMTVRQRAAVGSDASAVLARVWESTAKVALIKAVSANPSAPVIRGVDAQWAREVVEHCIATLLVHAERHIADNESEANHKKVLRLIEAAGAEGLSRSKLYEKTHAIGEKRDAVLAALVHAGQIKVIEVPTRTKPRTVYRRIL